MTEKETTSAKTPHIPVELDVVFRPGFDIDQLEAAIRALGGPDTVPNSESLEDLLLAWGWNSDIHLLSDGINIGRIDDIYGGWTWVEDDERLFDAILPWIATGAYIVFEEAEMKIGGIWGVDEVDQYEVWEFTGDKVEHKVAKTSTHFDW
jgi:hypothetical protein